MLGNRFHDAGTPPPLDLPGIRILTGENSSSSSSSEEESKKDTTSMTDSSIEKKDSIITINHHASNDNITSTRRPSHAERALELVESMTNNENKWTAAARRGSKASSHLNHPHHRRGILANLLKLETVENKSSTTSSSSHFFNHRPPLTSIPSSRTILHHFGNHKSKSQSARASGYFDDMENVESGVINQVALRMEVAADIATILERQDFIMELGKSLVRTGAPSHRIEAALEKTSKKLEINGSYFVLPGLIMVNFLDDDTHTSETHLIKCSRSLDIGKLEKVNEVAHLISRGKMEVTEAANRLDEINNQPPTWGIKMTLLGYVLSSAFIAPLFFNGSWTDCWVAGIFGLGVGIATFISERVLMFGNVFEMAVTIVVSIITLALHNYVCYSAVALSAVVIALPGFSLTSAVMELSAKNLCSGAIHLIHAIIYIFFLAFGMGYGNTVWELTHPGSDFKAASTMQTCSQPVDPLWYILMLPLACVGIGIVFGTTVKQYPAFTLNSAVGFAVYYFLAKVVGPTSIITPSVGAFALGLTANIYGRITKRLTFVMLMGGIIILVPGSIGVRGAVSLFDGSENTGGMFAFQIIGIALSITLGLFLANLCVYPGGRKRSVFLGL
ncbi:unnamed protein product [Cunninghamella blakesleeana]